MTLQELLTSLTRDLHAADTDAPALEARLLAGHVLHLDRIGLMLAMPSPVADDAAAAIRALTTRRCAGEPLAHITGRREFFGRDFEVSPQTLIPRPETELLLEIVLRECEGHGEVRFADLGTGTGCIGITLALELPHSRGLLLEYSAGALPVAARNISSLQAADRLALVRGTCSRRRCCRRGWTCWSVIRPTSPLRKKTRLWRKSCITSRTARSFPSRTVCATCTPSSVPDSRP